MSGMIVGVCRVSLRLPENSSLKGKRQVVRSLITRLRNKFNVAVPEVADTGVSNDARHAQEMLDRVVSYIERSRLDAELIESEIEVSRAF